MTKKKCLNLSKHGVDFENAQKLWMDDRHIEVKLRFDDEPRYIIVGFIDEKHWTAVITYRVELVRIISVRRSRKTEVALMKASNFDKNLTITMRIL
jgi:uncharacterized DUF497 family protein